MMTSVHRTPGLILPDTLRLVSLRSPAEDDDTTPYTLDIVPVEHVPCPECGRDLRVRHGKPAVIFDLPVGEHPVILNVTPGSARCRKCKHTVKCDLPADWIVPKKRVTRALARYLHRYMGKAPLRTLAARTGLSYHRVSAIQQMEVESSSSKVKVTSVSHLGLDEIFILKAKYLVAVAYIDSRPQLIKLSRASDAHTARTGNSIPPSFFEGLPDAKVVTVDMNIEQMHQVRQRWPKAEVIIDRRHLTELVNRDLLQLAQQFIRARFTNFQDPYFANQAIRAFGPPAAPYLTLRALVLRRQTNLTPVDQARWLLLRRESDLGRVLYEAYQWREALHILYDAPVGRRELKEALQRWVTRFQAWQKSLPWLDGHQPMRRTSWVIRTYPGEILNYATHHLTNAQTELTNAMIRRFLRMGHRFKAETLTTLVNTTMSPSTTPSPATQPVTRWFSQAELEAAVQSALQKQTARLTRPIQNESPIDLDELREKHLRESEAQAALPQSFAPFPAPMAPPSPAPEPPAPKKQPKRIVKPRRMPRNRPEFGLPERVWWWLHNRVEDRPLEERFYSKVLSLAPAKDLTAWKLLCAGQLSNELGTAVNPAQLQHWRTAVLFTFIQNNRENLNASERQRQPRLEGLNLTALAQTSTKLLEDATLAWIALSEQFASLDSAGKVAMTLLERWHSLDSSPSEQERIRTLRYGPASDRTIWDTWRLPSFNAQVAPALEIARIYRQLETLDATQFQHLMSIPELRWATAIEVCLHEGLDVSPYLNDLAQQRLAWFSLLRGALRPL